MKHVFLISVPNAASKAYAKSSKTSKSPVIRQKGEPQKWRFKKAKHAKCSKKWTFLTHWYVHARTCANQGLRNVRFRKTWRALFSWNANFEIHSFALLLKKFHCVKSVLQEKYGPEKLQIQALFTQCVFIFCLNKISQQIWNVFGSFI